MRFSFLNLVHQCVMEFKVQIFHVEVWTVANFKTNIKFYARDFTLSWRVSQGDELLHVYGSRTGKQI